MSLNYLVHIGDIPESTINYQTIVNATTEYTIYNAFKYTDKDGTYTIQKSIRSTNDGSDGTNDAKLAELIDLKPVQQGQFLMKFAAGSDVAFTGTINNSDQEFTYDGNNTITLKEKKAPMEEDVVGVDKGMPLIEIFQKLTADDAPVSATPERESEDRRSRVARNASSDGSSQPDSVIPGPAATSNLENEGYSGGKRKTKSKRSSKKKRNTKKKRKTQNKKKSSRKRSKK